MPQKKTDAPVCHLDIWGEGKARTSYLFDEDCADMCIFLMERYDQPLPVNLTYGTTTSLSEIAGFVAKALQYQGSLAFRTDKQERGNPRYLSGEYLQELGYRSNADTFWSRLRECCERISSS